MDKEVKSKILLGKNGTRYVTATKYADSTYSVDVIPGSKTIGFIANNELYNNKIYIIDRYLKGYKLSSLSVLLGAELDITSKYAIYSVDSKGLMKVINLDTFGILDCVKWDFQFLGAGKGVKKPYINIYLGSASGGIESYAVTNLIVTQDGRLDSNYYLGNVDYSFGENFGIFKKVNFSNIKRGKAALSLGSKLAYSPYSMTGDQITEIIDRIDCTNPDMRLVETYNNLHANSINNAESTEIKSSESEKTDTKSESIEIIDDRVEDVTVENNSNTVTEINKSTERINDSAAKPDESVNEIDRFYDSNGNCIDIEGLMAYLDSQQIEKQLEETNKIDNKSSLADILDKDTDLYQTYSININKLDAYKDMLGILSIYDTITLDKELSHKCLVIDDIVSGSTVKYIESGIDKDGVVQVNAENVPLNVIYICYVSNNGHKKYYLMHENQDVSTVKIQCISDTMKDYDYFNTNEFRQKYNNNKLNIQYIKL